MISFAKTPTRFGRGIGLLWRGTNLKIISSNLFSALKLMICRDKSEAPNRFLFESARSSIFHVLEAIGVGFEDEVIVSAFTCSAVTYSILLTGAKVVYVDINNDLTMNREALLSAITLTRRL